MLCEPAWPGIDHPVTNIALKNGTHLKSKYSNFGNWRTMSATECHVRNNDAVNSNTARLMNGANSPGLLIFEFANDTVVSNLLCLHAKKQKKKNNQLFRIMRVDHIATIYDIDLPFFILTFAIVRHKFEKGRLQLALCLFEQFLVHSALV